MIRPVCYDIAGTPARTRVSDYLEQQGFERVQYSVFAGVVDQHRWHKVWVHLGKLFSRRCAETDKIFSVVVERDHFGKMAILGAALDRDWLLQEVPVLCV
jgi:CRISPR-associated endonuclease Cas2